MGIYHFGRFMCRSFLSTMYKIEVIGKENIPEEGGVLLCCNHLSNFDPPLLGSYIEREVHYMAKQELFEKPILSWLLPRLMAYPVRRGMSDKKAFKMTLQLLKEGNVVGLFPEGTRTKDGKLGKGLAGAGFFALRGEASVIPCAIIGPYKNFKKVTLIYGEAIDFSHMKEEKVSAEEATAYIMEHIQMLIDQHHVCEKD